MSYLDLFTSPAATFGGSTRSYMEADYVVVGVPFDATSTYRSGSRFAPLAIREASSNVETYSFRAALDTEDLGVHDAGDLHVTADVNETLERLKLVTKEILGRGKLPIFVGGEHTLTLGVTGGLGKDHALLCFDAHLDLRKEYMDQPVCHATVVRRISEMVEPFKIIEVGTRAACKEEIDYARDEKIMYLTSHRISQVGAERAAEQLNNQLEDCDRIYLTIDMDVLDPAFAPAVQNPEPEGLSTNVLLDLLFKTCDARTVGFDITEVTPHYDAGSTAVHAAKIILETLAYVHRSRA